MNFLPSGSFPSSYTFPPGSDATKVDGTLAFCLLLLHGARHLCGGPEEKWALGRLDLAFVHLFLQS